MKMCREFFLGICKIVAVGDLTVGPFVEQMLYLSVDRLTIKIKSVGAAGGGRRDSGVREPTADSRQPGVGIAHGLFNLLSHMFNQNLGVGASFHC